MATYRQAEFEVTQMVVSVVQAYHEAIHEHAVTIDTQFAAAPRDNKTGEPKGAAVTKDGLAVPGKIKIMSQSDRIGGASDVRLILDGDRWEDWSEEQQRAYIDHCLSSIELKLDDAGNCITDDCNRPTLKKRPYDFAAVENRHGENSLDQHGLFHAFEQLEFKWPDVSNAIRTCYADDVEQARKELGKREGK